MPKSKSSRTPPRATLHTLNALQILAEDHARWKSDEHLQLHALHDLLKTLSTQQTRFHPRTRTASHLLALQSFVQCPSTSANSHSPQSPPLRAAFLPNDPSNATLFATRHIPEDTLLLSIPETLILTARAPPDPLAPLFNLEPTLAKMPSISLALRLLHEADDPASPFQAYLAALPTRFTTPFFAFSPSEMLALRPSDAAATAVRALRAQVRNYVHVYAALLRAKLPRLSAHSFSFERFRWAVSVAMTRQNAMPEDVGGMGLIPLWDLCNHEGGRCTTEVLFKEGSGVCVHFSAMRDFQEGEAVTMSYGNRSNVELVLYSGFVQRGNMNDVVVVKIGMDDKVEIAAFKARVLGRLGVDVRGVKGNGWEVFVRVGIGKEGISFAVSVARVVVMDKVGMNEMLKSGHALPDREMNRDAELRARGLVVKAMEDKLMQYDEVEKGKVGEEARQLIDELHECDKVLLKTGIVCLKGEEDVLPS